MARRKCPSIPAPVRRAGARLYRFGDEGDPSIWYPDNRVVMDDTGGYWVEVIIPEAPPDDPIALAQWYADQRDLEQVVQLTPHRRGGLKGAETRAGDNAAILDWARDQLAKDGPPPGPWALAGMLQGKPIARGLKQRQLYNILRPLYPQ